MTSTAIEFQTKVDKAAVNMERLDLIVNGSPTTSVTVDGGAEVPSFAKLQTAGALQVQGATDAKNLAVAAKDIAVQKADLLAATLELVQALGLRITFDDSDYPISIVRGSDKSVIAGLGSDKKFHFRDIIVDTVNGVDPAQIGRPPVTTQLNIPAQRGFYAFRGQSLREGSTPAIAITTAQQYDTLGFPATTLNPTAFVTATVANTQSYIGGANNNDPRGEWSGLSFAKHLHDFMVSEAGLALADQHYQIVVANSSVGGQSIDYISKGDQYGNYNIWTSQGQAGKTLSQGGPTYKVADVLVGHGEAGDADYLNKFLTLIANHDIDGRAINQDNRPIKTFFWQTPTNVASSIAQHRAHVQSVLGRLTTNLYHLMFGDNRHITALSERIAGAYDAYAVLYELAGRRWEPLHPRSWSIDPTRKVVTLRLYTHTKLDGTTTGIFYDTTGMPQVASGGLLLLDVNGNILPSARIEKVGPDTICIFSDTALPAGTRITAGYASVPGKAPFEGWGTNWRDNLGDTLKTDTGFPLHRWLVAFDITL